MKRQHGFGLADAVSGYLIPVVVDELMLNVLRCHLTY